MILRSLLIEATPYGITHTKHFTHTLQHMLHHTLTPTHCNTHCNTHSHPLIQRASKPGEARRYYVQTKIFSINQKGLGTNSNLLRNASPGEAQRHSLSFFLDLPRQDHVWITTDQLVRFHKNGSDESNNESICTA